MRVLIDYRPALRDRTGVGEWVHCLVSTLVETDSVADPLDLTVFSSSWKDRLDPSFSKVARVDLRIPVRLLNYCWHRFEWPPVEWLARSNFDVVHSPHPLLIPTTDASQIVTIHDLDFLRHPEHTSGEIQRDYGHLVREHAHRARRVIVPSQFTATEVENELGVDPKHISVCYNGAPPWLPRTDWPKYGHILFVGSLTKRKNIGTLLDAYQVLLESSESSDIPPLVLAGPLTEQSDDLMKVLEHPAFRKRVRHKGYVESPRLRQLYEEASVLVLPSLHEGFGLPVVEAMKVGVPVVTSLRGALPEIVQDAGLTVDATNHNELAGALMRMLTDESFAKACAQRGLQRAELFSWKEAAKALRKAYKLASS